MKPVRKLVVIIASESASEAISNMDYHECKIASSLRHASFLAMTGTKFLVGLSIHAVDLYSLRVFSCGLLVLRFKFIFYCLICQFVGARVLLARN